MKKLIFILPLFFLIGFPVLAKVETGVKNQNQIQNQNNGEDQQIQVQTQEMEEQESESEDTKNKEEKERGEGLQNRSQNALENMSEVAKKVQELLQVKTTGGIGDQVRLIAREQNHAQLEIQDGLEKISTRSGFLKKLFGTDSKTVKELKRIIEQNSLRIEQLQQLATQIQTQAEKIQIQEAIQVLTEQNTVLQDQLQAEEKINSLFGWLVKLFAK